MMDTLTHLKNSGDLMCAGIAHLLLHQPSPMLTADLWNSAGVLVHGQVHDLASHVARECKTWLDNWFFELHHQHLLHLYELYLVDYPVHKRTQTLLDAASLNALQLEVRREEGTDMPSASPDTLLTFSDWVQRHRTFIEQRKYRRLRRREIRSQLIADRATVDEAQRSVSPNQRRSRSI